MAKQVETLEVRIETALNAEPSIKQIKELRNVLKEIPATAPEFSKVSQAIADSTDKVKGAKTQSQDLIDTLASAPGPIGMLGRGLDSVTSSTNKWGLALKATGIGLLVGLVGMLVKAFSENEKAMKKLEPIMIMFEQLLGGIFAAMEPVFDIFIDLAMKAMPLVTSAIKVVYVSISTLLQSLGKLASSIKKLFSGDFAGAWEDAKSSVMDFGKTYTETAKKFDEGAAQTTKTQKKNLKEQGDAYKKWLEDQKAIYADAEKARQANLDKAKAIALSAAKTEEERLEIEKKYALDVYNSKKKLLEDQAKLYPKGSKEYEQFQTQLTALDAEYINKKTEFRTKDVELAKKAFDEEVKTAQDANKRKIDDLTTTYNLTKEKYGENSKEARAAQDAIFKAQEEALANERALYEKKTELTKEEKARLADIIQAQKNLTTTIQVENEKRTKADIDALVKKNEGEKAIRDKGFEEQLKANELNLQEQQRILTAKKEADAKYYADQEILLAGNVEKLNELNQKKLADAAKLVEDEIVLEQKRLATKLKVFDDIVAIAGAESAVGKAALIAKQLLLAKELFLEAKKTITFAAQAGARSTVAVAEGTAQTAKVGFPQNIPLLIGYAAQAVGIISAIVSAVKSAKASAGGGDTGGVDSAPAKDNNPSVPRPRGMASGGMVYGPGSGQSDLIPTMLSNGESVINAQSTSMFRPLLSSINQIGGGKGFASGGMAMNFNTATSLGTIQDVISQTAPIKTYVVASDMTNQQMLDRNIKERSTL